MDYILGVDPGVSGGMAVWVRTKGIFLRKFTTGGEYIDFVKSLRGNGLAVVEHVPKYVGNEMRASHSYTLGYNVGYEIGVLEALGISVNLVRPQKWQRDIPNLTGKRGAARKRSLKEHAKKLYPGLKVTLATANALLILDYFTQGEYR